MVAVTAQMVKELRQSSGAGVMDCKQALEAYDGDMEKAAAFLREKGAAEAAKRSQRATKEGLIGSYIHAGSKMAGLVEVNCETDFVARTDEFQALVHDLAMQVVAGKPSYVAPEDVPADVLAQQKADFLAVAQESGKPGPVVERIVEGKVSKFYEEVCLLDQAFIKDPAITVRELVQQKNALLGENIVIRRFARLEVGG